MREGSFLGRVVRGLSVAGRVSIVAVALVALFHVASPHAHASVTEENGCPACQLSRAGGGGLPEPGPVRVAPPAERPAPAAQAAVDAAPRTACAAPLPSRGPPALSPSEPL